MYICVVHTPTPNSYIIIVTVDDESRFNVRAIKTDRRERRMTDRSVSGKRFSEPAKPRDLLNIVDGIIAVFMYNICIRTHIDTPTRSDVE